MLMCPNDFAISVEKICLEFKKDKDFAKFESQISDKYHQLKEIKFVDFVEDRFIQVALASSIFDVPNNSDLQFQLGYICYRLLNTLNPDIVILPLFCCQVHQFVIRVLDIKIESTSIMDVNHISVEFVFNKCRNIINTYFEKEGE